MNVKKILEEYIPYGWKIIDDLTIGSCHSNVYKITNGFDYATIKIYLIWVDENIKQMKRIYEREIQCMKKLNNCSYLMRIEKYQQIQLNDEVSGDEIYGYIIQMPFCDCLGKIMADGKIFSTDEVVKIGYDLARGISFCHHNNIMHRDVKPYNIFIYSGKYILGDFGTAIEINKDGFKDIVGTLPYAAPEIINNNNNYDETIDIYSLGIVLYELLNNNCIPFAFQGISKEGYKQCIIRRSSGEKIPFIGDSKELFSIIDKCCQKDRERRYKSADEVICDFEQLFRGKEVVEY